MFNKSANTMNEEKFNVALLEIKEEARKLREECKFLGEHNFEIEKRAKVMRLNAIDDIIYLLDKVANDRFNVDDMKGRVFISF